MAATITQTAGARHFAGQGLHWVPDRCLIYGTVLLSIESAKGLERANHES